MRAFVLCTGRCGSTTFAKACAHIDNYTSGHETRSDRIGGRLDYPDRHIEVDNRLSWFLGTLDRRYGRDPLYVHLTRDPEETAESYAQRFRGKASIVRAFGQGIVQRRVPPATDADWLAVSRLCVATVTDNIRLFLRDKPNVVHVTLDDLPSGFDEVWDRLDATGDRQAAHDELAVRHNRRRRRG